MLEKVIEIIGKEKGPTSIILAGVHGNEKPGIEAFKKVLPNITIEKGTVFFIYGNPRAIKANQRFTEANLNRMFKDETDVTENEKRSYEYSRAQFLKKYLNRADALLDIHASSTPESRPFIICEANAQGIVTSIPIDLVVSGFDNTEPGGTDYYMNKIGKIGVCVECGYSNDPASIEIAEKSILAFLKARGHIPNDIKKQKQSYMEIYELYTTKTGAFVLSKPFADFEEIKNRESIGLDGEETIYAQEDSIILFARNQNKIGQEAFLLGKKKNILA